MFQRLHTRAPDTPNLGLKVDGGVGTLSGVSEFYVGDRPPPDLEYGRGGGLANGDGDGPAGGPAGGERWAERAERGPNERSALLKAKANRVC